MKFKIEIEVDTIEDREELETIIAAIAELRKLKDTINENDYDDN